MISNPSQEGDLEFLQPYRIESEIFSLSSGEQVPIKKYFLTFKRWKGTPIPNTYNGKAVIDWNGEPVFAELAVLRLFQSNGWDGVWVDSYHRKYRIGLPDVAEPVSLPQEQGRVIESIKERAGISGGCWDVVLWKDGQMLFIELKRQKKDRIQDSQRKWLEAAIDLGYVPNLLLIEWGL